MSTILLTVTHTKTFDGRPLAVVDGLPGGGAELTSARMRALAAELLAGADECERWALRERTRRKAGTRGTP